MVIRHRKLVLLGVILAQISFISCDGGENLAGKYGEMRENQAEYNSMENLLTDLYLNDLIKSEEEYGSKRAAPGFIGKRTEDDIQSDLDEDKRARIFVGKR